jgi:DNA-binding transcriptional regulator YdaS (Cro superfamily)
VYSTPVNVKQVIKLLQAAAKEAGGQGAYAKQIGVSPQFLSDVLHGRRGISKAILDALELEIDYVWKKRKPK